jgi:hypothetical protein
MTGALASESNAACLFVCFFFFFFFAHREIVHYEFAPEGQTIKIFI